jgi:hypothetical protein
VSKDYPARFFRNGFVVASVPDLATNLCNHFELGAILDVFLPQEPPVTLERRGGSLLFNNAHS